MERISRDKSVKGLNNNRNAFWITIFFVFIAEIIPVFFLNAPTAVSETNVIAIAADISGVGDWANIINSTYYYGYGTSVIFSFVFQYEPIYKDPVLLYRCFLLINVIINVIAAGFLYNIIQKINANKISNTLVAFITIATSLLLSKILLSKLATNENLYVLFYYVVIYIMLCSMNENRLYKRVIKALLLGLFCIAAYSVNGRGIILIGMVLVVYLAFVFKKRKAPFNIIFFIIALAVCYIAHMILKEYFINHYFNLSQDIVVKNNDASLVFDNFKNLFSYNGIKIYFGCLIGWMYYFIVSTYGLGLLAIFLVLKIVWNFFFGKNKEAYTNEEYLISGLVLGFLFGATILGASFYYNSYNSMFNQLGDSLATERVDKLIYGRYISTIKPIVISFVLWYFFKKDFTNNKKSIKKPIVIACSFVGLFVAFQFWIAPLINGNNYATTDIMEIAVYFGNSNINPKFGSVNSDIFIGISCITILIFAVFVFLWRKKLKLQMLFVLIGINLLYYVLITNVFVIPKSNYYYNYNMKDIQLIEEMGCDTNEEIFVSINDAYYFKVNLPDSNIVTYSNNNIYNTLDDIQSAGIVISNSDYGLDEFLDNAYLLKSGIAGNYVWIIGERLVNRLELKGYLLFRRGQIFYNAEELYFLGDAVYTDGKIILKPNSLQYGPYSTLIPAQYIISIQGENLDYADWDICVDGERKVIDAKNVITQNASLIQFVFETPDILQNVEFRVFNNSDSVVKVEQISLNKLNH